MKRTVFHASTEIFDSPRHSHYAVSAVLTLWPRNTIPNTVQVNYTRTVYVQWPLTQWYCPCTYELVYIDYILQLHFIFNGKNSMDTINVKLVNCRDGAGSGSGSGSGLIRGKNWIRIRTGSRAIFSGSITVLIQVQN